MQKFLPLILEEVRDTIGTVTASGVSAAVHVDIPPDNPDMPFIVISGAIRGQGAERNRSRGTLTVEAYTSYRGSKRGYDLLTEVKSQLDDGIARIDDLQVVLKWASAESADRLGPGSEVVVARSRYDIIAHTQ